VALIIHPDLAPMLKMCESVTRPPSCSCIGMLCGDLYLYKNQDPWVYYLCF